MIRLLRAIFPYGEDRSQPDYPMLRPRNIWIDAVAQILSVAAFGMTLYFFPHLPLAQQLLAIVAAIGAAVAVPLVWIGLATLPLGRARPAKAWAEFWRFWQLHYEVDTAAIVFVALPLAALGLIALGVLIAIGA
jgi:hypothetical protein